MRLEGNLRNSLILNQLSLQMLHSSVIILRLKVTSLRYNVTLQFYDSLFTQINVTLLQRKDLEVTFICVHLLYERTA